MRGAQKIAVLGTYLPRKCGIATFSSDLVKALTNQSQDTCSIDVIAINDGRNDYHYGPEVKLTISDENASGIQKAKEFVETNGYDLLIIQHEFGIFGGQCGDYLIELVTDLKTPYIATLHTILKTPNADQKRVMTALINTAQQLVVMTQMASEILRTHYNAPDAKIRIIPHGVPDIKRLPTSHYKDKIEVRSNKIILTFGLLSPSKAIEVMVEAMTQIILTHPTAKYIVLGRVHPNEFNANGTDYIKQLKAKAQQLGVENHVVFLNKFVTTETLITYLGASEIYAIPYPNLEQITSGTLSYALSAGKAVVSTPFHHAKEYLAQGRGVLAEPGNPTSFATHISELLSNPQKRDDIGQKAYQFTRDMIWNNVAKQYLDTAKSLTTKAQKAYTKTQSVSPSKLSITHLKTLTDGTGIFEHAKFTVPNPKYGYCTDDNARALTAAILYQKSQPESNVEPLINIYTRFLVHAFDSSTGQFLNRLNYDRTWDKIDTSDAAHGRAIWALGVAYKFGPNYLKPIATELLNKAVMHCTLAQDPHCLSYAILGLRDYIEATQDHALKPAVNQFTEALVQKFKISGSKEWPWYSDTITWGSAIICQALIAGGMLLDARHTTDQGIQTLEFLVQNQTLERHYFDFIGNQGWFPKGGKPAKTDQQPIEAMNMVTACLEAFQATQHKKWLDSAQGALNWFYGQNRLGLALADPVSGGCRDGLEADTCNENQGAESTLSHLIARLTMELKSDKGVIPWSGYQITQPAHDHVHR